MTKHPENNPAEPTPAIALPKTRTVEEGAVPQSSEAAMVMMLESRNTRLTEKSVYALPKRNWNEHTESRKADEYQAMWETVWNVSVMEGMAVAMMFMSMLARMRAALMVRRMRENLRPVG